MIEEKCALCVYGACPYGGEDGHPLRWWDYLTMTVAAFSALAAFTAGLLGVLHIALTWRNWMAATAIAPFGIAAIVAAVMTWAAWRESAAIRKEMDREDDDD